MFPIKDHNPSGKFPYITYSIIIICIGLWFYELSLGEDLNVFFESWALQPAEIVAGTSFITLISCMFLHGGWIHIIGNMLFLFIFWDNLESRMWHVKYLLFYLVSWFWASALQIYFEPSSMVPNIWASWAIAGVMVWYLLLYPKARIDSVVFVVYYIRKITLPAYLMLGYWFGLQLFSGVWNISTTGEWWVAYWAHVGGFIVGAILILPYIKKRRN